METLYLKLFELLEQIPELKYVDLDYGQLQEEKPPLAYPAALIKVAVPSVQNVDDLFQLTNADISITLVFKKSGETHSLAPAEIRKEALAYLRLNETLHRTLQGYEDNVLSPFSRASVADPVLRKGLKTTVHRYATLWREDTASS